MKTYLVGALTVSLLGCSTIMIPTGDYKALVSITVQDGWCYMDGVKVNGVTDYNTWDRTFCDICVSLKSDDPERTMLHELDHCWRNMMGLDAKARNP